MQKYFIIYRKMRLSVTKVGIVLHSQHFVMIPFFFSDCKFFSEERVKIFWKNRGDFLNKFFLGFLCFGRFIPDGFWLLIEFVFLYISLMGAPFSCRSL